MVTEQSGMLRLRPQRSAPRLGGSLALTCREPRSWSTQSRNTHRRVQTSGERGVICSGSNPLRAFASCI